MGEVGNAWSDTGPDIICLEENGSRPSHFGDGFKLGEAMYTLNTTEVHAVAYRIGSFDSNAMKSSNPQSGIYQTDLSCTLDAINCGYPGCNQGGVAIVQAVDARNCTEDDVNGTIQNDCYKSLNTNIIVRVVRDERVCQS